MGCRGPFAFEGSRSISAKLRPADGTHAWPCRTTKDAPRRVKCCRSLVTSARTILVFPPTWPLTDTRGRATATARPGWRCVQFTIFVPHAPTLNSTLHPAAYAMLCSHPNLCSNLVMCGNAFGTVDNTRGIFPRHRDKVVRCLKNQEQSRGQEYGLRGLRGGRSGACEPRRG